MNSSESERSLSEDTATASVTTNTNSLGVDRGVLATNALITEERAQASTQNVSVNLGQWSQSRNDTNQPAVNKLNDAGSKLEKMSAAVRTLLECIGEDPDREGLLATPSRYANALLFFAKGYEDSVEEILSQALFNEGHSGMIIVKDIEIHSLCEHHLVPFTGKVSRHQRETPSLSQADSQPKMHIGYIPTNTVIGLSKLARVAEMYARRLQIQECLTSQVANAIMKILQPQGVMVVMQASHMCMVMRGVEKTSASTTTSCALGCFEKETEKRSEFLTLVGLNGK